jgi:PAS domain S-box-containing protein
MLSTRSGSTVTADSEPPPSSPIEARLHLAAIIDSSDDAIISKDFNGIITSWNASASRLFGYRPEEIIGKSVLTLIPTELHSEEPEILRRVTSGERIEHFETRRQTKSGELIDISLTISPIRDGAGRIVGISKIARDITDRKQAEAALFEAERLAAIGRMAASISHEVNNPLEAIMNLGYLLRSNPSLDQAAKNDADTLISEVVRVSEITRQTLSFYRESHNPSVVDIRTLVESVVKLHRPMLDQKTIQISMQCRASISLHARAGELRQVFTNLLLNAIDALPCGGRLKINISSIHHNQGVCVTFADNGPGIPEEVRKKIFEPFFSTKRSRGTGLGLWISQGIVRKYGGSIAMRSSTAPGRPTGTIFRICLPNPA